MSLNETLQLVLLDPLVAAFLFLFCIAASYTDLKQMRISDDVNFFAMASGIIFHAIFMKNINAVFGALAGFLILLIPAVIINARMGGDIKFCTGLGAWIGPMSLIPVLSVAVVVFTAYAVLTKHKMNEAIPFAPFLSSGVGVMTVYAACLRNDPAAFLLGATLLVIIIFMTNRIMSDQNIYVGRRVLQ